MQDQCKAKAYAPLVIRLALAVIFIYHGFGKVFGAGGFGTAWNPHGMPAVVQVLVAWGELLSGVAMLLGLFTRLAGVVIIVVMAGAIVLVHGQNGFDIMNMGFEYNFALIAMALSVILSGPGALAIESKKKGTEPSAQPESQQPQQS